MPPWVILRNDVGMRSRARRAPQYRAFTVLELMVVIAVISILAALIVPALSRSKLSARATGCLQNLRQIGLATQLSAEENDSHYPVMFDAPLGTNSVTASNLFPKVATVLTFYLGSTSLLRCPSDDRGLFERTGCSYAWNTLLNGQVLTTPTLFGSRFRPNQIPLFFDRDAFHRDKGEGRGVNYVYLDGHVDNQLSIEPEK